MIYKAIEKCVSGTRRLRVHEANVKISITMQISSPSTKMIPQGFWKNGQAFQQPMVMPFNLVGNYY
jgi:hypothetical protein